MRTLPTSRRPSKPSAPKVTVASFKGDPLFPRVERAVAAILSTSKVVTPIDVLIRMDLLRPADVEDWRLGRVPYLERVIWCNLTKLGRILRILRMHVHDLKLVPSHTAYVRWGEKGRRAPLRFTKTGAMKVEEAYSRHFVWPGKGPFHPPREKTATLDSKASSVGESCPAQGDGRERARQGSSPASP